jgi:ABC-type Fe3+-hydroxamate transport system substrate-binding protein
MFPAFFEDQLGRKVLLQESPQRIVSVVPSQTSLLFYLGLGDRIVGRTKFCIHPRDKVLSCSVVGGTKNLRLSAIQALQPDLILANKEENDRQQIEALAINYPVWVSDIATLEAAMDMIRSVGQMTQTETLSEELMQAIAKERKVWQQRPAHSPLRAAYLIWQDPLMVTAGTTFIDTLLQEAGFVNVFGHLERYPQISPEQLSASQPDVVLLSSEPYPFREKHIPAFQTLLPSSRILIADGELFSWYGNHLLHSFAYFRHLHQVLALTAK